MRSMGEGLGVGLQRRNRTNIPLPQAIRVGPSPLAGEGCADLRARSLVEAG